MTTKRSQEGYLDIDHRNSPGTHLIPGGTRLELATVTCSHCHRQMLRNPARTRDRMYCRKCDAYICDACAGALFATGECRNMEKLFDIERQLASRELPYIIRPGGLPERVTSGGASPAILTSKEE